MRKQRTKQERIAKVAAWESSGQTLVCWCTQESISPHTFRKWVTKFGKSKENPSNKFIPIKVDQTSSLGSQIEIIYPNGVRIVMPSTVESKELKSIINLYHQ